MFQFGKMRKFSRWTVVTVAQQRDCAQCLWPIRLKVVSTVNWMSCIFCHTHAKDVRYASFPYKRDQWSHRRSEHSEEESGKTRKEGNLRELHLGTEEGKGVESNLPRHSISTIQTSRLQVKRERSESYWLFLKCSAGHWNVKLLGMEKDGRDFKLLCKLLQGQLYEYVLNK